MKSFRIFEILAQKKLDSYENDYPHSTYISPEKYPEQSSIVGSEVYLSVRDDKEIPYNEIRKIPSSGRPEDDSKYVTPPESPDDYESPYYFEEYPATVLRCDTEAPYVFIAVTIDYEFVLIGNSNFVDDIISGEIILSQPIQFNKMIGEVCHDRYNFIDDPEVEGRIIRADAREISDGVVAEKIGDELRYVLFSECESVLTDLPSNYDNADQDFFGEETEIIKEKRRVIIEGLNI